MKPGPLYQQCLDAAAERRANIRQIRSTRRLARLDRFLRSMERARWKRQGKAVVWR